MTLFGFDIIEFLRRLVTWVPVFIFAICVHEAAHAWAAWRLGDPTPVIQGRLTLNPKSHLDPLGTLMFLFALLAGFGFGWAKPVPVNPMNFRYPNRDMALVAAAGPASNVLQAIGWTILLSFFSSLLSLLPMPVEWAFAPLFQFLARLCIAGVFVNLGLAVFNLIPVPPLDGSRILRLFLPPEWRWRYDYMERTGIGFLVLLMLLWFGVLDFIWMPVFAVSEWLIRLAT